MKPKIRRFIAILILLISVAILLWGIWPSTQEIRVVPVAPTEMQLPFRLAPVVWGVV